jgi:hypothetical protein
MEELGRFGILADERPIRLGGRVFDVLMALIEASRAVVSKDALLSIWQGRIVDQTGSQARHLGVTADRHEHIRRASIDAGAGSRPSCTGKKRSPWL